MIYDNGLCLERVNDQIFHKIKQEKKFTQNKLCFGKKGAGRGNIDDILVFVKSAENFLEKNFLISPHHTHDWEGAQKNCNSRRSRTANFTFFSTVSLSNTITETKCNGYFPVLNFTLSKINFS